MTMIGKVIHYTKSVGIYYVNDYMISRVSNKNKENKIENKWFCSCSIKYKRNPTNLCKHILFIKRKEN